MEALAEILQELLAPQRWDELKTFLSQKNSTDLTDVLPSLGLRLVGPRSGRDLSSLYSHAGGCAVGLYVLPDCQADSFSVRKPATTSRA